MSLLNRTKTKRFIIQKVKATRPGWDCTRVSDKAIEQIESWLRYKLARMVHSHPSNGKTFKEVQL